MLKGDFLIILLFNNISVTKKDRSVMLRTLMKGDVPTARHLICDRSDPNLDFIEKEDSILINGSELKKPFVEKPFDGDDHNICIYYHSAFGGGRQELFRKIGNQSSTYSSTRKRSLK